MNSNKAIKEITLCMSFKKVNNRGLKQYLGNLGIGNLGLCMSFKKVNNRGLKQYPYQRKSTHPCCVCHSKK